MLHRLDSCQLGVQVSYHVLKVLVSFARCIISVNCCLSCTQQAMEDEGTFGGKGLDIRERLPKRSE